MKLPPDLPDFEEPAEMDWLDNLASVRALKACIAGVVLIAVLGGVAALAGWTR